MATSSSKKVIFAALVGNTLIAITKYAAAWFTGSSAMFSEAIHSTVDTGNQGLLLYGLKRAARKPDEKHPFGYGPEIYFWAFVVAILIFALGAGISIYEGIEKVRHPTVVTSPIINYVVLGLAMVFEGVAWWIAYKAFNTTRGKRGFLEAIRVAKDPSIVTVLLEDSAAMLGLIAAFVGIALGQALDMPVLDGAASLAIGGILASVAWFLAYEMKGLLIGEAADPEVVAQVRRILTAHKAILRTNEVLTMHLGPRDVLLNLSVDFKDGMDTTQVEETIGELERRIKAAAPQVKRIYIEAQSWQSHARERRDERR
jgi:cation diffusion facilitator family transporter